VVVAASKYAVVFSCESSTRLPFPSLKTSEHVLEHLVLLGDSISSSSVMVVHWAAKGEEGGGNGGEDIEGRGEILDVMDDNDEFFRESIESSW